MGLPCDIICHTWPGYHGPRLALLGHPQHASLGRRESSGGCLAGTQASPLLVLYLEVTSSVMENPSNGGIWWDWWVES